MFIFEKRISSIMDGSSDDNWDDKVKTQIEDTIKNITEEIQNDEKASDFIKDGTSVVENMKQAAFEYVLAYNDYEKHRDKKSRIKEIEYTKEAITTMEESKPYDGTAKGTETKVETPKTTIVEAPTQKVEEKVSTPTGGSPNPGGNISMGDANGVSLANGGFGENGFYYSLGMDDRMNSGIR